MTIRLHRSKVLHRRYATGLRISAKASGNRLTKPILVNRCTIVPPNIDQDWTQKLAVARITARYKLQGV